jgi:hypothetical protein
MRMSKVTARVQRASFAAVGLLVVTVSYGSTSIREAGSAKATTATAPTTDATRQTTAQIAAGNTVTIEAPKLTATFEGPSGIQGLVLPTSVKDFVGQAAALVRVKLERVHPSVLNTPKGTLDGVTSAHGIFPVTDADLKVEEVFWQRGNGSLADKSAAASSVITVRLTGGIVNVTMPYEDALQTGFFIDKGFTEPSERTYKPQDKIELPISQATGIGLSVGESAVVMLSERPFYYFTGDGTVEPTERMELSTAYAALGVFKIGSERHLVSAPELVEKDITVDELIKLLESSRTT